MLIARNSAVPLYGYVITGVALQLLVMESCDSLRPDKRMSSRPGLEIDNEKVENNSIFDNSKKVKNNEYRPIDNGKSILFADSANSDGVNLF